MRRRAVGAAALLAAGLAWSPTAAAAWQVAAAAAGETPGAAPDTLVLAFDLEATEARYRVREQLARLEFPNDAVGVTSSVAGSVVILGDGTVLPGRSRIEVDLASLESDQRRRDRYVRRNTLETDAYPSAVLVPTEVRGLDFPLPTEGERSFQLAGDLTVHGVTRRTVWDVVARFGPEALGGTATTSFTFADFGLEIPRVAMVLSVVDRITLELDFRLVLGAAGAGFETAGPPR